MDNVVKYQPGRREFIQFMTRSVGLSVFAALPVTTMAGGPWKVQKKITVGDVMDLFIKEVANAPFAKTVDTLKSGSRDLEVTGIVTTMFATLEVIQKAINLKANFIIAHEPVFYNHQDETKWLENDDVYQFKAALLEKHKIAVWRNHDYIHSHNPDGVRTGLLKSLAWDQYADKQNSLIVTLPATPLKELILHAKAKLGIPTLRYEGDLSLSCRRLLLLPGAAGGNTQIRSIGEVKPDLVIVGELSEWETAEYIRDARLKGNKIGLIILGHAVSEEAGMQWMVSWLQPKLPGIKVDHVSAKNPLSFL